MATTTSKQRLGDIFISHSSKDKGFVRRLADGIEAQGYSVWLDERQLLAGDYLPATIGDAIHKSRVSIIVLSRSSIVSNWVKYEISQATGRMINRQMRLIPVRIDSTELPPELRSLVYVDFGESFDTGLAKTLHALDTEASKYDLRLITQTPVFGEWIEDIIREVFGSVSRGSVYGEYKSVDFQSVMVGQTEVWYEVVSSYGYKMTLRQQWWDEFSQVVADWGVPYVLMVTERPVSFEADEEVARHEDGRVILLKVHTRFLDPSTTNVVVADLSELDNRDDLARLLRRARDAFEHLAGEH